MTAIKDANGNRSFESIGIAVGDTFSFSLDVRVTGGGIPQWIFANVAVFASDGAPLGSFEGELVGGQTLVAYEWKRVKIEGVVRQAAFTFFNVGFDTLNAPNGAIFECRRPMLNAGDEALAFTPVSNIGNTASGTAGDGDFVIKSNPSGTSAAYIRYDENSGSFTFNSNSDLDNSSGNAVIAVGEFIEDGESLADKYAAASHAHAIGEITDLQDALDGKADTVHAHADLNLNGGYF